MVGLKTPLGWGRTVVIMQRQKLCVLVGILPYFESGRVGVNTCLKMSVFHGPEMKGNILFKATSLENCCRTAKTQCFLLVSFEHWSDWRGENAAICDMCCLDVEGQETAVQIAVFCSLVAIFNTRKKKRCRYIANTLQIPVFSVYEGNLWSPRIHRGPVLVAPKALPLRGPRGPQGRPRGLQGPQHEPPSCWSLSVDANDSHFNYSQHFFWVTWFKSTAFTSFF